MPVGRPTNYVPPPINLGAPRSGRSVVAPARLDPTWLPTLAPRAPHPSLALDADKICEERPIVPGRAGPPQVATGSEFRVRWKGSGPFTRSAAT